MRLLKNNVIVRSLLNIYRRWFLYRRSKETEKLIGHMRGIILDLGSGVGIFNSIIRKYSDAKIYAVDNFPKILSKNDADVKVCANLENSIPFHNESFDIVLAFEIVEHLDNRVRFIKEIYRILKANGLLFLTTPNKHCLIGKFDRLIKRCTKGEVWNGHNSHHKYLFTQTEITNLLNSCNFTILKSKGFYFFYGLPLSSEREYQKSNDGDMDCC